ncbi:MAG: metallophosphoesterase [Chloroflexi bacterium]|nr:metallophosphoesterase [Chloroflexota bacterium]
MSERLKRVAIAIIALLVVAVAPIAIAASNGAGAKPPTASHGPKRTPTPTPTKAPTAPPTTQPTLPPTPAPTPTVAPTGALPFVLAGAGDIASCSSTGDEATATLLDSIAGSVFTLGDNAYSSGTTTEFNTCYGPSWGRTGIKSRTRPAPGNHDYGTAGATGYYGYFGLAAGDPAKGYYAYDAGGWRVYVLNSNCSSIGGCATGSPQEQWLRSDLAANPRSCVLAMWHQPRFSSGSTHGSSTATQALYQALYDFGAEIVLAAHEHNYERFAPQTATGTPDSARGLVEFVVGTGGASHYGFGTPIANSVVRDGTTYGVLRLVLSANSWTFSFLPVAGQTFTDSGSGTCH